MDIQGFMQGYKAAWERRDPAAFASLFHADGRYHNLSLIHISEPTRPY